MIIVYGTPRRDARIARSEILIMPAGREYGRALLEECRRRLLGESLPRLRKCLGLLSPEEIWRRPNGNTPGVGNLVLHLCGNVRQWIVSGLGGAEDARDRPGEFSARGPLPTEELLGRLERTLAEADRTLRGLDPGTLLRKRTVQGFEETGLSILVHVVEHFSYHVGQVTRVVKSTRDVDVGYYAGLDLDRTGSATGDPPRTRSAARGRAGRIRSRPSSRPRRGRRTPGAPRGGAP